MQIQLHGAASLELSNGQRGSQFDPGAQGSGRLQHVLSPQPQIRLNGYGFIRTTSGTLEGSIRVTIQLTSTRGVNGFFDKDFTVVSSSDPAALGLITVPLLKGATYRAKRETGGFQFFTTTQEDTFELGVFFGP